MHILQPTRSSAWSPRFDHFSHRVALRANLVNQAYITVFMAQVSGFCGVSPCPSKETFVAEGTQQTKVALCGIVDACQDSIDNLAMEGCVQDQRCIALTGYQSAACSARPFERPNDGSPYRNHATAAPDCGRNVLAPAPAAFVLGWAAGMRAERGER